MRQRVVWFVCDAATDWVVRALLAEQALPAMAKLVASGVLAASRPPRPYSQTPPGLATLFTGVAPARHGITGYSIPDPDLDQPVTAAHSGFSRAQLRVPPAWELAADAGLRSVLVHVPFSADLPPTFDAVEAYSRRLFRGGAIPISDARELRIGDHVFTLEVDAPPAPLWLDDNVGCLVQLWRRPSDAQLLLIHSGGWHLKASPANLATHHSPFVGEGLGFVYRAGAFGTTAYGGGHGDAEQKLVETIGWAADYFHRASLDAIGALDDADLYVCYQPAIDDVQHELIGLCDRRSIAYQPQAARTAWEAVRAVYQMVDRQLGALLDFVGEDATIIMSSDHGMSGVAATLYVNQVLADAGLLAFAADGKLDQSRTTVCYHPANNGTLWINDARRPGGTVPPSARGDVLTHAVEALGRVHHSPLRIRRLDPRAGLGDLFLEPPAGYHLSPDPGPDGASVRPTPKSGSHLVNSGDDSLNGVFAARGPALARGRDLGTIDNRDVLPLVCQTLGIEPPPHLEGQVPPGIARPRQLATVHRRSP